MNLLTGIIATCRFYLLLFKILTNQGCFSTFSCFLLVGCVAHSVSLARGVALGLLGRRIWLNFLHSKGSWRTVLSGGRNSGQKAQKGPGEKSWPEEYVAEFYQ
jgi:hypothetical protein